jgi:peptidoglycan-associated lipoprotein
MKKNIRKTMILLTLVSLQINAWGQSKYVIMGNEAYENKQYVSAILYYSNALNKFDGEKPERNEVVFKLADCARMTNDQRKAENNYLRLIKNKYADEKPVVYLYYATALYNQGKYAEALPVFDQYLSKIPDDPLARVRRASCELSIKNAAPDTRWVVKNIREINSSADDFASAYSDKDFKTLVFSSNRKGTTGKELDNWTDGYFSDLFISTKKKDDTWGVPMLADDKEMVNTQANEGVAGFDVKFKKIYFTRCSKMGKEIQYCQILEADRTGNGWGRPNVIYTDAQGNVGHPTLTSDGLTLVFSSNKSGGQGGKDLWKATRTTRTKSFGPAENLGRLINTPGDEMFPMLFADTILYYASNGKVGFGGLDIYRVVLGKNGLSDVEHLPRPINSSDDDFAMNFKGNTESGFFSSRRSGGRGGDDIYSFEKIATKISLQGSIIDEVTGKPLSQLTFSFVTGLRDTIILKTDDSGTFKVADVKIKEGNHYALIVSKDNYFTRKGEVAIGKHKSDTVYQINIALQPIPNKPIVLPDIYYDLNKWDLLPQYQDSLMILVQVLNDNPKLVIELASHTDSRATTEYNDILSQKRAESVVLFLTEKGINNLRLVAKGYGERMPRVLTADLTKDGYTFERGTNLTEEYILKITDVKKREVAYQLNRRTEFSVIGKNFQ